ncbi:LPS export ABC transporter ATP-binding protein [Candidatus Poribacteria bacterium]|nr:MAG: LPS export ABC transporter ATP-binding protein [Candidatus Poribacteria bacterium]
MKLATHDLVKRYSKRAVVDHVSIELEQGEIVGLLGPNGAGKTTTFYMIVGIVKADEGRVTLGDRDITDLPMYKRARMGIGYLSQEPSIFRKLTVEENIMAVLEFTDLSPEARRKRARELMSELGIEHLADQKAYTLSGGEQRRVEIARTLAISPSFILLDEPFSGIDPIAVHDIKQIIVQLKERGLGILLTDHNAADLLDIVDRAYLIADGRIILSGTPEELIKNEMARRLYFGEGFKFLRE